MFAGKHFSCPSESCGYFIKNEKNAFFIAGFFSGGGGIAGGRISFPVALHHRLKNHSREFITMGVEKIFALAEKMQASLFIKAT